MVVKKLTVIDTRTKRVRRVEELEFNKDGSLKHLPSTALADCISEPCFKIKIEKLSEEDKANIMKATSKKWHRLYENLLANA